MSTASERLRQPRPAREGGSVVIIVIILLALAAGGYWFLQSARNESERQAREFAEEFARKVGLERDRKYLNQRLSREGELRYPPSYRERMFARMQQLGEVRPPVEVAGKVEFRSQFFSPKGRFKAQLNFPGMPATLEYHVSKHGALWKVDDFNFRWHHAPQ